MTKGQWGVFALFVSVHSLCCAIPALVLSGVSLAFLAPVFPILGGTLAVLGLIGLAWYLKGRGAASPANEASRPMNFVGGSTVGDDRAYEHP